MPSRSIIRTGVGPHREPGNRFPVMAAAINLLAARAARVQSRRNLSRSLSPKLDHSHSITRFDRSRTGPKEWDGAPMPHSIFFTDRGHAIHASNATRSLGWRASHGCVRLAPSKAATLFALVRAEGVSATKVLITNGTSAGKAARSRTADGSARRRTHVRRAFSDPWQMGSGARGAE